METKTIFDKQAAEIMLLREQTRFAKARAVIKELKDSNAPIYWDILWDGLRTGGDKIIRRYIERFAKEHFLNINDIDTLNVLRRKFSCLEDPTYRYPFPQEWCSREEDGSFDIDLSKLEEYCSKQCTYTITGKEYQAIKDFASSMKTLGLYPSTVRSYFGLQDGKIVPIGHEIYKLLNGKASGRTEDEAREQKFKAVRQVKGLNDEGSMYM